MHNTHSRLRHAHEYVLHTDDPQTKLLTLPDNALDPKTVEMLGNVTSDLGNASVTFKIPHSVHPLGREIIRVKDN